MLPLDAVVAKYEHDSSFGQPSAVKTRAEHRGHSYERYIYGVSQVEERWGERVVKKVVVDAD